MRRESIPHRHPLHRHSGVGRNPEPRYSAGWRVYRYKSPQPPFCGRGACCRCRHHSAIPALTVIPAKAGIHTRHNQLRRPPHRHSGVGRNPEPRYSAGWRVYRYKSPQPPFCGRGLAGVAAVIPSFPPPFRHSHIHSVIPAPTVIPAKAGIHTATAPTAGVLDSGLRRNDGGGEPE